MKSLIWQFMGVRPTNANNQQSKYSVSEYVLDSNIILHVDFENRFPYEHAHIVSWPVPFITLIHICPDR